MTNTPGDGTSSLASARAPADVPRWAVILFAVAAALQAIDGVSGLPSLGHAALAALSGAALFFIATGRVKYALWAMSATLLSAWVGVVASADPAGGEANTATLLLFVMLPVIAAIVAILAWRGTRLTLATLLASLPTLLSVVLAFVLGVAYAG